MKRRRWIAVPVAVVVIALLVFGVLNMTIHRSGTIGTPGTLSGVERCARGSLYLSRFECSGTCDDTSRESIFLRWNEEQSSVRFKGRGDDGEERPISKERRMELLKEFAALPRAPDDPAAPGVPPLRYSYVAGGECDSDYIGGDTIFLRIDPVAAVRGAPIEDAPEMVLLWLRGPGHEQRSSSGESRSSRSEVRTFLAR